MKNIYKSSRCGGLRTRPDLLTGTVPELADSVGDFSGEGRTSWDSPVVDSLGVGRTSGIDGHSEDFSGILEQHRGTSTGCTQLGVLFL